VYAWLTHVPQHTKTTLRLTGASIDYDVWDPAY